MWTQTRISQRLGVSYPIIQGPFGGGYSSTQLIAAVSNGGGLGSLGANNLTGAQIRSTVAEIRALTARPFAVNLWVPLPGEQEVRLSREELAIHLARLRPYYRELGLPDPEPSETYAPSFEDQLAAVLETTPPVFSFIFGVPPADALAQARRQGIATIGTATTVEEAVALERAGVDFVVASGNEAGGHRGAFLRPVDESSLIGTFALVPQVVDAVEVPVIAAGGIADGRGIAAALALGAEATQIGTALLVCDESGASPAHKAALLADTAWDTALTRAFSGRHARGVRNRFMQEMRAHEASLPPYPIQSWLTQPIRRAAAAAGRSDLLGLWSGQAARLCRRGSAAERLDALVKDTERVLGALASA